MARKPTPPMQWFTTPHKTHHCHLNNDTWATVRDGGTYVKLIRWFKGCGLAPHESICQSIEQAKQEAQTWLATQ